MLKRYGTCFGFCFFFLVVGIVIGGCIIAPLPRPNHIHFTVMPNQAVNVSPEVGDVINWAAYGQATGPTITFSPATGSPCQNQAPGTTCSYTDSSSGIFLYHCSGSALCDPGVGPSSGTGTHGGLGVFSGILKEILRLFESFVLSIDRALGFLPTPNGSAAPVAGYRFSPNTNVQPALLTTNDYDGAVGCGTNKKTAVDPPNIDKTKSGNPIISWGGSTPFTLTIDQSICSGNTSTAGPYQQCQLVGGTVGTPYSYTVNDDACTNQKQITATITPR
jgi:hypothetical protein